MPSKELSELQDKISEAQRREAQTEVARNAARERLKAAVTSLREEFGVSTVDEAKQLLSELERDFEAEISRIDELLEEE